MSRHFNPKIELRFALETCLESAYSTPSLHNAVLDELSTYWKYREPGGREGNPRSDISLPCLGHLGFVEETRLK
ncbi:uncharacterized protein L203_105436 [Cryptococcus depauperatus CBS 7841]|uniref:Uncharacterized protein n=1 Tax=Cryptococcus depauperatus CBS 7841 TaxID=1295531 RepID=A0AAJ8JXF1_9TREE